MQTAQAPFYAFIDESIIEQAAFPAHTADKPDCLHRFTCLENLHYNRVMRSFEFNMSLSFAKTESIYQGQARYIMVESDQGLKLQLPAINFRQYVTELGINGRFRVVIDNNNKIIELAKI